MDRNSNSQNKRKRAVNFTDFEVRLLIDVVLKYMHIVENKTSDAVTWKQKQNVWEDIASEFNPLTGQVNRSAKELRLKYECIKKKIKKKQSHNKFERFKTGGGIADIETFTDYEEKILNYIVLSVDGLLPEDDCDGDYLEETQKTVERKENQSNIPTCISGVPVMPYVVDFDINMKNKVQCNNNLKGSSQKNLMDSQDINKKNKYNNNLEESSIEIVLNPHDNNLQYINNNLEGSGVDLNDINKENKEFTHQTSSQTWSQWNSTQLKTAKHKALIKKTKPKPIHKETLNTKIATVTDSRQELLVLQIHIAKKEEERKSEEHAEKLKNIKLEGKGIIDKNELFAKECQLLELKITNEKLKQQLLQLELKKCLQE